MADLEQTTLGWRTLAPDGSEIHLPDEVAREAFPDFFAQPEPAPVQPQQAPVVEQPSPSAPGFASLADQTATPLDQSLAQGQLPAGVTGARTSHSGYRPKTKPDRNGLLDVESFGAPAEAMGNQVEQTSQLAEQGQAAQYQAQLEADQAYQPYADQKLEMQRGFEQAEVERQTRAAEELAGHEARIQQSIMEIPHETPGRWWHNMDSFDTGMATLTMMMGGIQAMKTGGQNQIAQFALELTDRDMRAQEQEIATAKAKVGYAEEAYGRSSQKAYHDKLDLQEMKALKLETFAAGLEKEAAKFKSKFTQAKFLQSIAGIRAERDKILVDITNQRSQLMLQAASTNANIMQHMADRAQRERFHKDDMALESAKAQAKAAEAASTGTFVGESTGFKMRGQTQFAVLGERPEDRYKNQQAITEKGLAAKKAYIASERMKSMISNGSWFDPAYRGEIKQLAADITMGSVAISGQSISRSSDKDMQMLQAVSMGNDPLSAYQFYLGGDKKGGVQNRLQAFQDNTRKSMNEYIHSYGDAYKDVTWDPGTMETEKAGGVTDVQDASAKLKQLQFGDPNIAKGELVPKTGGTYAPRDVRAGQLDPNTVEFKAGQTRETNPEYDNVGAAKGYAETIVKEVHAGKLSMDQAGEKAIELYEAARKMAPQYPTEAEALHAAGDYVLSNITKQAGEVQYDGDWQTAGNRALQEQGYKPYR